MTNHQYHQAIHELERNKLRISELMRQYQEIQPQIAKDMARFIEIQNDLKKVKLR